MSTYQNIGGKSFPFFIFIKIPPFPADKNLKKYKDYDMNKVVERPPFPADPESLFAIF